MRRRHRYFRRQSQVSRLLVLESLEDRRLLATVDWIGGSGTSYGTAANWSPANVPASTDDAVLTSSSLSVNANGYQVKELRAYGTNDVNLNGKTLTFLSTFIVGAGNTTLSTVGAAPAGVLSEGIDEAEVQINDSGILTLAAGNVDLRAKALTLGGYGSGTLIINSGADVRVDVATLDSQSIVSLTDGGTNLAKFQPNNLILQSNRFLADPNDVNYSFVAGKLEASGGTVEVGLDLSGSGFIELNGTVMTVGDDLTAIKVYAVSSSTVVNDNITLDTVPAATALPGCHTLDGSLLQSDIGWIKIFGCMNVNPGSTLVSGRDLDGPEPIRVFGNLWAASGATVKAGTGAAPFGEIQVEPFGDFSKDVGAIVKGESVRVMYAGRFQGEGDVDAALFNSGTLLPGCESEVGQINIYNDYVSTSLSTLAVDINSTSNDLVTVLGNTELEGELQVGLLGSVSVVPWTVGGTVGSAFTILSTDGDLSGERLITSRLGWVESGRL